VKHVFTKYRKLQEAKARLQQLQDLMAAVTDFHSRGQTVPDQYIDLLSQEVAREEEQGEAGRAEIAPSATARLQRHSVERERTPVRQQVLDRYEVHHAFETLGRIVIYLKAFDQLQ
jgi:hypothetical protein